MTFHIERLPLIFNCLILFLAICCKQSSANANRVIQNTYSKIESGDFQKDAIRKDSIIYIDRERLPYDEYNLFKDSIQILDEFRLKFHDKHFIYQAPHLNVLEQVPGIVTIENRVSSIDSSTMIDEIKYYNSSNERVKTWKLNEHNPWKVELGGKPTLKALENNYGEALKYLPFNRFSIQRNTGRVCIYYNLALRYTDEDMTFKMGTYIVLLDSLGNMLYKFKEESNFINHAILSMDKKYLFINGSKNSQEPDSSYMKIIEVKTGKIIFQEELENGETFSNFIYTRDSPELVGVDIEVNQKNTYRKNVIYNLITMEKCTKNFSNPDYIRIDVEKIPFSYKNWLRAFNYNCNSIKN